jgi:polysaccharide biosynthesis/export protein
MKLGKSRFARGSSLFALLLVLVLRPTGSAQAQDAGTSASAAQMQSLPAAQPLARAAKSSSQSSTDSAQSAQTVTGSSENAPGLKLAPGDLIEVSVYNVPELSAKARVGKSGEIYLPLIDYVHVGGLGVEEAQELIRKRLEGGGFVRNAHVTIFLDESASQGVTILGEVARPGIYPAVGERKLYDLISAAGGFTATAGRKVSVIRQGRQSDPITINLPRNLADDLQDNIEILPGDTITVPRAPIITWWAMWGIQRVCL